MAEEKTKTRRGDAQAKAYEILKEMIIVQELPPNELVSEKALSDLTGFGRAAVRTALQNLKNDGLVEIYAQRGCRISEIDVVVQMKVLEVRAELERLMVVHAARNISDSAAKVLTTAGNRLQKAANASDSREYMNCLKDVHELTVAASENEILARSINQIQGLSRRFWYAHHARHGDMNTAADLHKLRVNAICERNEKAAARASDELVRYLARFTEKVVTRKN